VAKGFSQVHGVDFDQTFSHVVKYESIRAILAPVAHLDMDMVQFDICTAFLYGSLEEETYMHQPLGYASKDPTKSLQLLRSLYGLRQSARIWNAVFKEFLLAFNLPETRG
jgi:hypothetical protein